MPEKLIMSKLNKPYLPSPYIAKKDLLKGIYLGKINLICAPAGSGKSTLMSHWIEESSMPYLWYGIDQWDNNFVLFLKYIQRGLQNIDASISSQMNTFLEGYLSMNPDSLIKGIVALLQEIKKSWVFVLDDYHLIEDPRIHTLIKTLFEYMPKVMTICLLTREDPPLNLGRLRAQQKLFQLRAPDLKLSLEETSDFFEKALNYPLADKDKDYFYNRCEGWIAGIQIVTMVLKETDQVQTFIDSFSNSHDYIMDYLLEEVLNKRSRKEREFLLKSSILLDFNEQQCAYVLNEEVDEIGKTIHALIRSNSFLMTLNREEKCYRYHHLFKHLLNEQLENYPDIDEKILYTRAGFWYEEQKLYSEAISNYIIGKSFEKAQRLIELRYAEMDRTLNSASWLEWTRTLPDRYIKSSPVISLGFGWALLDQGNIKDSQQWFEHSQKLYNQYNSKNNNLSIDVYDKVTFKNIPVLIESSEAYKAAISGNYKALLISTNRLTEMTAHKAYNRQWIIDSFLGMMYWGQGKLENALEIFKAIQKDSSNAMVPTVRSTFTWIIAEIYIQLGKLTKAELLIEEAIQDTRKNKILPFLNATFFRLLATIECIRGQREKSFALLEKSKTFGFRYEFMDWGYKYNLLKARLFIQEGLFDQAKESIKASETYIFLNPTPETVTVEDLNLWLTLLSNDDERKSKYFINQALELYKSSKEEALTYDKVMYWKVILSNVSKKDTKEIFIEIGEKLLEQANLEARLLDQIDFSLIISNLYKDYTIKEKFVDQAKMLAKNETIMQPFIEFDPTFKNKLINQVKPFEVKRLTINELLSSPLTPRELEVLDLIQKGYSNREISNQLFIALSTVKSYNNSLFSKLAVKRRTQAVAKGLSLGLLK